MRLTTPRSSRQAAAHAIDDLRSRCQMPARATARHKLSRSDLVLWPITTGRILGAGRRKRRRHDPPHRADRAFDLLLSGVPAVKADAVVGGQPQVRFSVVPWVQMLPLL